MAERLKLELYISNTAEKCTGILTVDLNSGMVSIVNRCVTMGGDVRDGFEDLLKRSLLEASGGQLQIVHSRVVPTLPEVPYTPKHEHDRKRKRLGLPPREGPRDDRGPEAVGGGE